MSSEIIPTARKCTLCLEMKDLSEFHNTKSGTYGKASMCKLCKNARDKKRINNMRSENGQAWQEYLKKRRARAKRYRRPDNPFYIAEKRRRWLKIKKALALLKELEK